MENHPRRHRADPHHETHQDGIGPYDIRRSGIGDRLCCIDPGVTS